MTLPAISVAMSVFNGEAFLDEAIESVRTQGFADFEFLIVDDGSSDSSPAIIRRHAQADPRIVPILRENRGLVASLNEMIERARAPVIARMDADDACRSDRFAKQIAFLTAHPDHGVVGSWSEDIGEDGAPLRGEGADHPVSHQDVLAAIERGRHVICHPVAMFRRDVVRQVGGYHAAFRHCEDFDLWLRLASVTRIANIPERLIRYRRYPGQVSNRHSTEQQIGTAVAKLAWRERRAGRTDPTENLERLPPIDELDELFGREGVAQQVRAEVTSMARYSIPALRSNAFPLVEEFLRNGGDHAGMWRTVARLLRGDEPLLAARLARILLTTRAYSRRSHGGQARREPAL